MQAFQTNKENQRRLIDLDGPESLSSKDTQIEKDKCLDLFDGVDLFAVPAEAEDPPTPQLSELPDSAIPSHNVAQPEASPRYPSGKQVNWSNPCTWTETVYDLPRKRVTATKDS